MPSGCAEYPHGHFDGLRPEDSFLVSAAGGFPSWLRRRGALERLKLEIEVAVYNWETRRGLPHFDGGFKAGISAGYKVAAARRKVLSAVNVLQTATREKAEN